MSFYDDMAATANELLTEFGAAATLQKVSEGTYNPATGGSTDTTTNYTCTAAVFDVDLKEINGTLIQANDKRAYVSVLTAVPLPEPSDFFIWQGVTYRIAASKDLAPSGKSVLFELVIRR